MNKVKQQLTVENDPLQFYASTLHQIVKEGVKDQKELVRINSMKVLKIFLEPIFKV